MVLGLTTNSTNCRKLKKKQPLLV